MINDPSKIEALADRILAAPFSGRRRLVAIAGAPASGKSTLAEEMVAHLNASGQVSQVVPMDGFHLDNEILKNKGILDRKGSPASFDADGFVRLIAAFETEDQVYYPLFDRGRDIAIAGAGCVDESCETVVVEGNYLLLDEAPWSKLSEFWEYSVWVDVSIEILKARLLQRWLDHGLSEREALDRITGNDLPNAEIAVSNSLPVDEIIRFD